MTSPVVYADFQNLDDANRLRLTCAGTLRDLRSQGLQLREGMVLTFRTDDADNEGRPDDLLADGTVHYDQASGCWVAEVDWAALRHASDEARQGPAMPQNGASRHSADAENLGTVAD